MSFRCSEEAAERADPALGTAPPQGTWLLVEHHGPWPVSAPFDTDLPAHLVRALGHPARRLLLVRPFGGRDRRRRPEDADRPVERRWFASDGRHLRTGTWVRPEDLLATLDPDGGRPLDPTTGPLLLVCTHGVHDVCCAVQGRPVAAALTARWPERTFECSHLGGDRFAANLLVLPDGACYSRVPEESAVALVEAHVEGRPDLARLRGVSGLHPAEQVAQAEVLRRWGPAPLGAAVPSLAGHLGDFDSGEWTVDVAGTTPLPADARVVVGSRRREHARLTCRAARATAAVQWDVLSVTT